MLTTGNCNLSAIFGKVTSDRYRAPLSIASNYTYVCADLAPYNLENNIGTL